MNIFFSSRKGQITIFIIVGIIIVAGVALFFIFRDKAPVQSSSSENQEVYVKILSCVESLSQEGVKDVALNGGYYVIPEEVAFHYYTDEVPYYYLDLKNRMPSLERVEREIGDYIKNKLDECVNFTYFEEKGFEFNRGTISADVTINMEDVDVNVVYPVSVSKGEDRGVFKYFNTDFDSDLGKIYYASESLIKDYSGDTDSVCLTCIDSISEKYAVHVKATPLPRENVLWFSVSDIQKELNLRFVVGK